MPKIIHENKDIAIDVNKFIVLEDLIKESELVISHCGAGILLECLRSPTTTCLAVVNDTLMNNHQTELADKLADNNYIYKSVPSTVLESAQSIMKELKEKGKTLKRYPEPDGSKILSLMNEMLE